LQRDFYGNMAAISPEIHCEIQRARHPELDGQIWLVEQNRVRPDSADSREVLGLAGLDPS
jgi:hypothetical protein